MDLMRARNIALWALALASTSACANRNEPLKDLPAAEGAPRVAPWRAPDPACAEASPDHGAWPRALAPAVVVRGEGAIGRVTQTFEGDDKPSHLRFLGTHMFDLLDKLHHEGGATEAERRRVICAALNAAAAAGAPVIRLWGSLKRTGTSDEVARAADLLALVIDENTRRARPLRFIVTLLNHQSGYGAPKPEGSLDDQDPASPWHSKKLYLEGGFRAEGAGSVSERIRVFGARSALARAPEILAWELVNELDTHRFIAGGTLRGPEADTLRDGFLIPLASALAETFTQPIMVGDLRGHAGNYEPFAASLVDKLPPSARARLVWTSHAYASWPPPAGPAKSTWKLDRDLAIAARFGLPLVLGEIGQHSASPSGGACARGKAHDLVQLFAVVIDPRPAIEAALFWGEGRCGVAIDDGRSITLGAGGDSADLGPDEQVQRDVLARLRAGPRFLTR